METNDKLTRLTEGAGPANPFRRTPVSSRPEEGSLDVSTAFHGLENPAGGLPGPTMAGPPYTVKDGAWRLFHVVKTARHAHDRMVERTPFDRSNVEPIQKAVDTLGLKGESYHLPLRGKDGAIAGYAQFKRVPNRKGPVLATVLAKHMSPGGENIEAMLKRGSQLETNDNPRASGQFDTDHIDPRPPESRAWNRRHQHGFAPEQGEYALRKAFDGVTTNPRHEVIESTDGPSNIPDMT